MTIEDGKKKSGLSLFAKHAVQFYIVGATGVIVNLYLLTDIGGFWYVASQIIAISVSITTNFFFNRYWTFGSFVQDKRNSVMYVKFLIVSAIGMSIQLGITVTLVESSAFYHMYGAGIGIAVASAINYVLNRRVTFGIKFKN
jgi:dolichol-phosphate mannosyltransferase